MKNLEDTLKSEKEDMWGIREEEMSVPGFKQRQGEWGEIIL